GGRSEAEPSRSASGVARRFAVVGNERLEVFPAEDELLPAVRAAWSGLRLRDYAIIEAELEPEPASVRAGPNPPFAPDAQAAGPAEAGGLSYKDLLLRIADEAWQRHVSVARAAKTA